MCEFMHKGNKIRCQCYVKAYPSFWESFPPRLCTFMEKETNMPWAESRAVLSVHLISKNLFLIKIILFTMQRFIGPHCIKEVWEVAHQCHPARKGAESAWIAQHVPTSQCLSFEIRFILGWASSFSIQIWQLYTAQPIAYLVSTVKNKSL